VTHRVGSVGSTAKECWSIPSRVIATSFALVSFATAAIVGLYVGNDLYTVVGRAVVIMFGCYIIGLGIGRVAQWVVDDHIHRYQHAHPIPTESDEAPESRAAA